MSYSTNAPVSGGTTSLKNGLIIPYAPTATHRIPPTKYKILINQKLKRKEVMGLYI
jgi:hypothetical protein